MQPKEITSKMDHILTQPSIKNRVAMVGIELEGGWNEIPKGIQIQRDGSVAIPATTLGPKLVGELPSKALEVGADPEKSEIAEWMRKHYPPFVNQTCGMHVHMSFKTALTYQRMMTPSYPNAVLFYLKKWAKEEGFPEDHHIWNRLAGKSHYARAAFNAASQVQATAKDFDQRRPGNRYTVINYCWGRYNTLECRVLPMMAEVEQAIRGVNRLIRITNAFLVTTASKEPIVESVATFDVITERVESHVYV